MTQALAEAVLRGGAVRTEGVTAAATLGHLVAPVAGGHPAVDAGRHAALAQPAVAFHAALPVGAARTSNCVATIAK